MGNSITKVFGMGAGMWHLTFSDGSTSYGHSGMYHCDDNKKPSCAGPHRCCFTHEQVQSFESAKFKSGWGNINKWIKFCYMAKDLAKTSNEFDVVRPCCQPEAPREHNREGIDLFNRVNKLKSVKDWVEFFDGYDVTISEYVLGQYKRCDVKKLCELIVAEGYQVYATTGSLEPGFISFTRMGAPHIKYVKKQ